MSIDLHAATWFMAASGRLLDRRRLQFFLGDGDADEVLAALDAYRNADGGYGWGLEPDLRSAESQPTAAMHAFEVLAELAPTVTLGAVATCAWLEQRSLADGGLPMALAISDPAACASWWVNADRTTSSLQMTAQVAANAHLVARHDPAVAGHPWLAMASKWCLDAIRALDAPDAHELLFAVRFLDAASDVLPEAAALLDNVAQRIPTGGSVPVAGGVEGEMVYPLDFAPYPERPARRLFSAGVIAADLDRLSRLQQDDGGWVVDFPSSSPAAALDWRGYATVAAVMTLRHNSMG